MESCGPTALKWFMLLFNLLFFVCGIGMIVAGSVAHTIYKDYFSFLDSGYMSAPVLLIVVGVFIMIAGFFGCCGSAKEHSCMLMTYSVLLGCLFILGLSGGIAAYVERSEIETYLGHNMEASLEKYSNSTDYGLWDKMQHDLKCCGVNQFDDWLNSTGKIIPDSCCKNVSHCSRNETGLLPCNEGAKNPNDCPVFKQGCLKNIKVNVERHMADVGGVGIGIAFLQLIGIMISCFLARRVRRGYTYG